MELLRKTTKILSYNSKNCALLFQESITEMIFLFYKSWTYWFHIDNINIVYIICQTCSNKCLFFIHTNTTQVFLTMSKFYILESNKMNIVYPQQPCSPSQYLKHRSARLRSDIGQLSLFNFFCRVFLFVS